MTHFACAIILGVDDSYSNMTSFVAYNAVIILVQCIYIGPWCIQTQKCSLFYKKKFGKDTKDNHLSTEFCK